MRTLTAAQQAATSATCTDPAYFIELGFSSTVRLSSRDTQSWDGYTWTGGRIRQVSGLSADGSGDQKARIELINSDLTYSTLVLAEGVADQLCKVWQFYGNNPTDASLLFDGVIDEVLDINAEVVILSAVAENLRTMQFPRRFVGPGTGFNHLSPAGKKISWGGQTYIIQRKNR